jgi:hypothetical protein
MARSPYIYIHIAALKPGARICQILRPRDSRKKACVGQRTDLRTATEDTPAMPQLSIPNSHSREAFLSPTPAVDADNPTEQPANP